MATAIEFENISKQYRLGLVSTQTLAHDLRRFWITKILRQDDPYLKIGETNDRATKGTSDYVWALRDINFKVEQGDVVGIIGKNGAGKSTLLKLLSRVTGPTTGTIRAHGRIGSLLEVGTGFHGEMTGRENIFMNGAILGMTRQEIQSKLDEIIDFSGCERYIDTPVKRYSSGMTVRLGFAVAAFLEPEILVVDEVLAVGDAEFQKKAIGKMKDVSQGQGRTVLFVSHNMGSVKALCNRGILLENGMIKHIGNVSDTIDQYINYIENIVGTAVKPTISIFNSSLSITSISINGKHENHIRFIGDNERRIAFLITGNLKVAMNLSVEIMLFDTSDVLIASYSPTNWDGSVHNCARGQFEIYETIVLPKMLTNGEYHISLRLSQMNIEHIALVQNIALISIEDLSSPITGNTFDYSYYGGLILHS